MDPAMPEVIHVALGMHFMGLLPPSWGAFLSQFGQKPPGYPSHCDQVPHMKMLKDTAENLFLDLWTPHPNISEVREWMEGFEETGKRISWARAVSPHPHVGQPSSRGPGRQCLVQAWRLKGLWVGHPEGRRAHSVGQPGQESGMGCSPRAADVGSAGKSRQGVVLGPIRSNCPEGSGEHSQMPGAEETLVHMPRAAPPPGPSAEQGHCQESQPWSSAHLPLPSQLSRARRRAHCPRGQESALTFSR